MILMPEGPTNGTVFLISGAAGWGGPEAALADALSTAVVLMAPAEAASLNGGGIEVYTTPV